ncbi:MAG: GNAT family N-acetyltransferase [Balneolaceae bacterium]
MKFLIRNVEIEDSESLTELSNQLGYKSELIEVQKRLMEILKNNDNCVFMALEGEKIVGWGHGFYSRRVESDPFVEIGGLVVDIEYRKKGIGKLLVEEIKRWASTKKCKKVRVRCNTIRKETHIFYQKLGFEITKNQKVFDKRLK